jgi:hypothetical protein
MVSGRSASQRHALALDHCSATVLSSVMTVVWTFSWLLPQMAWTTRVSLWRSSASCRQAR